MIRLMIDGEWVEVEGQRLLPTACNTPVADGMVVRTASPKVLKARKNIMELILARHSQDCLFCAKNGACELQKVARDLNMNRPNRYETLSRTGKKDESSLYCPVGAISIRDNTNNVYDQMAAGKTMVIQMAPSVRINLAEALGAEPGTVSTGKSVHALKKIGFDKVFDSDFSADLTIMEEGSEFLARLKSGGTFPMFTSCCPAWVKYCETYGPELLPHLSTAKSPQQIFGITGGVMACPGGCIGGGGNPPTTRRRLETRREAIYREDRNLPVRKSHENPYVQQVYQEFLGEPLGEKSHELLHTTYISRRDLLR